MTAAPSAWSQPNGSGQLLVAEALYKEGKGLFEQGRYPEACPKLAESQRLDPGGGTLLLLALCHEKEGKIASAWVSFKEALLIARRDKREDRAKLAKQHIDALDPKIPTIQLKVDAGALTAAGATLLLDDQKLSATAVSVPLPVDPGERVLELQAPGKKPWRQSLRIAAGEHPSVNVPSPSELPSLPTPPASATASAASSAPTATASTTSPGPAPAAPTRSLSGVTIALGAVGIVGLGLGTYWGLDARSRASSANSACPTRQCADPTAVDDSKKADRSATFSDVAFAVGGAALVAGAALYILLPPSGPGSARSSSLGVAVAPGGARLSLGGAF